MTRITPNTQAGPVDLVDFEPYEVKLKAIEWSTGSAEYGGEQRLQLDWELSDGSGDSLRDWIGLRLGQQKDGTFAKLRSLLNALSEKPEATAIPWFDTDTLEWGYSETQADNRLAVGQRVIIRGQRRMKADGTPKFTITAYQPIPTAATNGRKRRVTADVPAPAVSTKDAPHVTYGENVADEDIPF